VRPRVRSPTARGGGPRRADGAALDLRPATKRVLTGTSLALGVAVLLFANRLAPAGLIAWSAAAVLALLGTVELAAMGSLERERLGLPLGLATAAVAVLAGALFPPASPWVRDGHPFALLAGLAVAAAVVAALAAALPGARASTSTGPLGGLARAPAAAVWCVVPLFGLVLVDARWGTAGLVALVACAKVGDVFGYFVGRAIGRRHPFPRLSPGKTVAGCVASLVATVVLGGVLAAFGVPGPGWLAGAASGLAINLAAQAGDLLESAVKRRVGVKDSGRLAGASGGVLDVVDSLLVAVPAALAVWPALFPTPV